MFPIICSLPIPCWTLRILTQVSRNVGLVVGPLVFTILKTLVTGDGERDARWRELPWGAHGSHGAHGVSGKDAPNFWCLHCQIWGLLIGGILRCSWWFQYFGTCWSDGVSLFWNREGAEARRRDQSKSVSVWCLNAKDQGLGNALSRSDF